MRAVRGVALSLILSSAVVLYLQSLMTGSSVIKTIIECSEVLTTAPRVRKLVVVVETNNVVI